ncbi:MAG: hypothetical protein ACOX6X_01970 [Dethiobacteria bacterium]
MATALLIETISIQDYVYASNRLLENVGASYIVSNIYQEKMKEAIQKTIAHEVDFQTWRNDQELILLEKNNTDFEIGYIGGGNALLFFREKEKAREFVKNWTTDLLIEAPGLNFAFALDSTFEFNDFQNCLKRLFETLKENKSRYFPLTSPLKHGITADCPFSGGAAEVFFEDADGKRYISSISHKKFENAAKKNNRLLVEDILGDKYTLTNNIEKLGQGPGKNHIAVVHIDGNMIGKQFMDCTTLPEIRKLSVCVDEVMYKVYREFLGFLVKQMDFLTKEPGFNIQNEGNKTILPFRPILIEGDDITFLTDGRLGVCFAKKYLELMSCKTLPKGARLSASAGVAIAGTKYPFYRCYTLAEELCSAAKREAREKPGTSWLDFHVAYGGFSSSLEEIRKANYSINEGQLNFGPYLIPQEGENGDFDNEKNIKHLTEGIKQFLSADGWPRNRVKELRGILTLGKKATEQFLKQMDIKGNKVHAIPGRGYHLSGWENNKTPYFDMIELLDFYPEHFLNE